ncbi:hypothetical protein [Nonomuraea sp. GTA35]|uniref:hypothetical protein n=1 Tax=Nonomuraea sp. GTA35 TaxID=1676746 RepID=UPI0035BF06A9
MLSWLVVFFVRVPTGLRVERRPGSVPVGRRLLDHLDGDLALFETVELSHAQLDVADRDDAVVVAVVVRSSIVTWWRRPFTVTDSVLLCSSPAPASPAAGSAGPAGTAQDRTPAAAPPSVVVERT